MKNINFLTSRILVFTIILYVFCAVNILNAQDNKSLLTKDNIEKVLKEAYNKYKDVTDGKNADYIKELATVDPNIFGISLVTVDGQVFEFGDISSMVSIQSVSKVFTMAKVIEEQGYQSVLDKIGVDATGEVFNSITAVERMRGKEINPLVNPGAIAATSLIYGSDSASKWASILKVHIDFAGRKMEINMPVYISEA